MLHSRLRQIMSAKDRYERSRYSRDAGLRSDYATCSGSALREDDHRSTQSTVVCRAKFSLYIDLFVRSP